MPASAAPVAIAVRTPPISRGSDDQERQHLRAIAASRARGGGVVGLDQPQPRLGQLPGGPLELGDLGGQRPARTVLRNATAVCSRQRLEEPQVGVAAGCGRGGARPRSARAPAPRCAPAPCGPRFLAAAHQPQVPVTARRRVRRASRGAGRGHRPRRGLRDRRQQVAGVGAAASRLLKSASAS